MATVQIKHEEDNSTSTVTITLQSTILSDQDMVRDSYLLISTNIKRVDGSGFPTYLVRDLTDVAPGAGAATTWTELVNDYIEYFVAEAEFGQSSSSSSSSSDSSSSSSEGYSDSSGSSSSSEGYSESSSSEGYSESSSSEGYSESSSSEGYSESSSSEQYSSSSSS
jgi:hypothetical protein